MSSRRAGRRPTPTHLRLIRGNPRQHAMPEAEPEVPGSAALMPPWLRALDAEASGLTTMSVADLRTRAKALKVARFSRLSADELVDAILEAAPGPRELSWSEIAGLLDPMRVLTALDVHALAMTIEAYVDYIQLSQFLLREGTTYETVGRYGLQVKRRPETEIQTKRWEQVLKGLIEFGCTPASRTKVRAAPRQSETKFSKMQRGRRGAGAS